MKIELENVKPMDIEERSFEIITQELGDTPLLPGTELIVKRCIHTSADFDYAKNLCFSEGAVEKAMEAIMQSTGDTEEIKQGQDENIKIYKLFMSAKESENMERSAVELLAENYKKMFALDNARSILLDLSKEYLQNSKCFLTDIFDISLR